MPALIGVSEFVEECSADYKSPITSTFVSRMNNMRQTILTLEEVSKYLFLRRRHCHPSSAELNESAIKIQLRFVPNLLLLHFIHTNNSYSLFHYQRWWWLMTEKSIFALAFYHFWALDAYFGLQSVFIWFSSTNPIQKRRKKIVERHLNSDDW